MPSGSENIFASTSGADPKITMDLSDKVTTKLEIALNDGGISGGSGIVFKLTQTGIPYLIGRRLANNFVQKLLDGDIPYTDPTGTNFSIACTGSTLATIPQQSQGTPYIFGFQDVQGKTIEIKIIPTPSEAAIDGNNLKVVKYIDYIEANFEDVFDDRYWMVEIIDKNTMIPEEGGEVEMLDNIYSQIERVRIDIN